MSESRIGHGYDIHRLRPGGALWMGGVVVSREMEAIAHSDGDVVIHAIVDALLGAVGKGDIGEMFPNSDAKWKDAASSVFLETVWKQLSDDGWRIGNLDVTILAEQPKLKELKPAMKEKIAVLLGASVDSINIKAGTNEGCDAIGRGEAVACHAVVMVVRENG